MKKVFLPILIILIPAISFSQKSLIKDIHLEIRENNDIIINYNLSDKKSLVHNVDFILIDNKKNNVYIPQNTIGAIGGNIKNGQNSISFNMLNQTFPLHRELTPAIIVDQNLKKGPKSSILSVLIPGLGDYFVAHPKNMIIKPYYRTLAVGSFLALALIADSKRIGVIYYEKTTKEMVPGFIPSYVEVTHTYEKSIPNDFWLFNYDKEIFLGFAAGIWIYDIFWVLKKGRLNQNIKRTLSNKNYSFNVTSNGFSCKINLN